HRGVSGKFCASSSANLLAFVCGPPWAWIDGNPVLRNTGWFAPRALARVHWAPPPITAMGSTVTTNCPKSNGYPFHPSEQDTMSAAGIKDQELTIIVSIMLIELPILRLRRAALFKRLGLTQGSRSRCIRELGGRDARDD